MDAITFHLDLDRELLERVRQAAARLEWGSLIGHLATGIATGGLRIETNFAPEVFVPTAFQQGILYALEDGPLRSRALDLAVKGNGRLYKEHGLRELIDQGLVVKGPQGYSRPEPTVDSSPTCLPLRRKAGLS